MFYIQREGFVGAKVKLQSTTWALVLKAIWQSVYLQCNIFGILVLRTQHQYIEFLTVSLFYIIIKLERLSVNACMHRNKQL